MIPNQITLQIPCRNCSGQGGSFEYTPKKAEYPGDEWHWKKCRSCTGACFSNKAFSGCELEPTAEQLLKTCDWYIDYSDSYEARCKANTKQSLMHQLLALLEKQTAITLWKKYSPHPLPTYLQ